MKRLYVNILYSVSYQLLNIAIPILTTPYLSRVLGAEMIGMYSYTFSIASYFVLVAMLGINNYGNRTIASVRDDKYQTSNVFWNIYLIQLVSSILMIFAYLLYLVILAPNSILSWIWIIYVISASLDISWYYFGIEEFKLIVIRNFIIKVITVVLIFLLIKSSNDIWVYTVIISISTFINQSMLWFYLRKRIFFILINIGEVKKHIKPIIVLFVPVVAVSLYTIMDKIMLGILSNIEQIGYFDSAQKIMVIPTGLITALGVVMLPKMSNIFSKGQTDKVNSYISISLRLSMFLSFALASGLAGISETFTPIFFGSDFMPTGNVMALLSISIIFIVWANVIRTQYLIPSCRDKVYLISVALGAITNILFNFLLIPHFGAVGAAIGTVLAEFTVAFYQTWAIRNELNVSYYLKNSLPFLFAACTMFIFIKYLEVLLSISVSSLLIQICVGAIVYLFITTSFILIKNKRSAIEKVNN